jgi:hypothetical protein
VKVVISRSTCAVNDAAIGKNAFSISSMRMARDPASAIMEAARRARPSFPLGSCADPTRKSSLTFSCGTTDRCTMGESEALAAGASDASGGTVRIAAGSGSFESVVCTRWASVR